MTELTARPLLSLYRPELAQFVQPLAGEWAGRRDHLESLSFPVGYGVEIAVLLDTYAAVGLAGMAQSDLGCRTHSRQSQQALGVMAAEVLGAAAPAPGRRPRRRGHAPVRASTTTARIDTPLAFDERPPVAAPPAEAEAHHPCAAAAQRRSRPSAARMRSGSWARPYSGRFASTMSSSSACCAVSFQGSGM